MRRADGPLVSIICITYNQEKYITQAIEGFLEQKTTFPFEIILSDDCSTDANPRIINEYAQKYPDLIRAVYQPVNLYSMRKKHIPAVIEYCKGKYAAVCEGDDYWIDPYKLQKQADFLEEHQDYGLVHTNFDMLHETSGEIHKSYHSHKAMPQGDVYEELLHDNFIWTVTVMARRKMLVEAIHDINLVSQNWPMGDYPMFLAMSQKSKIGYIDDVTSTYRVLANSAVHSPDPIKRIMLTKSYNDIKLYFIEKYGCSDETRLRVYAAYCKFLLRSSFSIGDYELARAGRELFLKIRTFLPWKKQWKERCVAPFCANPLLFLGGRIMYVLLRFLQCRLNRWSSRRLPKEGLNKNQGQR